MIDAYCNLLIAYPYLSKGTDAFVSIIKRARRSRLLVDSGAFTAWKAGSEISLDDYCRFIEGLPIKPWRYFTLDKIGDPEGTIKNYETMLARGLNPVPIFTRGEDLAALDYFYKTSDVVGIGGLVGTYKNRGFVRGIMRHVGSRKCHWLGFTQPEFLKAYRPYMCDSSTWECGARFGSMKLYMGRGKFERISKQMFTTAPKPVVLERIRQLGIDPYRLQNKPEWHGGANALRTLCSRNGVALSVDIEKNLGTKVFNALTTTQGCTLLVDSFNQLYPKPPVTA